MTEEKKASSRPPPLRHDYRAPSVPPPPPKRRHSTKIAVPPPTDAAPVVVAFRNKLQSISDHEGLSLSAIDPELEEFLERVAPEPDPSEPPKGAPR